MVDLPELPDDQKNIPIPLHLGMIGTPEFRAELALTCELAFRGELNKTVTNARQVELQRRWKTMSLFSTRQLGPGDVPKKK